MEQTKKSFSLFNFIGKIVFKIALFFVLFSAICTVMAKVFNKKLSIRVEFDDIDENTVEGEAEEKDELEEDEASDAE